MTDSLTPAMLELLASKICHDLISPIGAVNNGVELIQEMGADAGPEAMDLIAFSAAQASAKLKAFRLAYGAGGADGNIKPADVHHAIEEIVGAEKKIRQAWEPHSNFGTTAAQTGFCKILTCIILLAMESLPKGGSIAVKGGDSVIVTATGTNATLRDKAAEALVKNIPEPEPKDIHARMTGIMARHYGFTVSGAQKGESVEFSIVAG